MRALAASLTAASLGAGLGGCHDFHVALRAGALVGLVRQEAVQIQLVQAGSAAADREGLAPDLERVGPVIGTPQEDADGDERRHPDLARRQTSALAGEDRLGPDRLFVTLLLVGRHGARLLVRLVALVRRGGL